MNTANNKRPAAALLTPRVLLDPSKDGETHINISLGGATELGRKLPHFAVTPFVHPIYGPFKSMEGFWHYAKCEKSDDLFRTLSPSRSKSHAKTMNTVFREHFIQIINEANYYRIEQTEGLKELMINSWLPFKYYYLFGDHQLPIEPKHAQWLCAGFEEIRRLMKEGKPYPVQPRIDFSLEAA
jgi:hypothetical protein